MDLVFFEFILNKEFKYFFEYFYFIGGFVYLYNFGVLKNVLFYFFINYFKIKEKIFCKFNFWF